MGVGEPEFKRAGPMQQRSEVARVRDCEDGEAGQSDRGFEFSKLDDTPTERRLRKARLSAEKRGGGTKKDAPTRGSGASSSEESFPSSISGQSIVSTTARSLALGDFGSETRKIDRSHLTRLPNTLTNLAGRQFSPRKDK
jgi:hypothetical protein